MDGALHPSDTNDREEDEDKYWDDGKQVADCKISNFLPEIQILVRMVYKDVNCKGFRIEDCIGLYNLEILCRVKLCPEMGWLESLRRVHYVF